jgi:hypothetical protein
MGGLVDGKPRFLMDRYRCSVLFAACKGGYQYRRLQTKEEKYGTEPDKNRYSHPADALQYLLVGEGETKELRVPDGFNRARQPQTGNRDGNPISRRRARTQSRSQRRIRAIHDRLP